MGMRCVQSHQALLSAKLLVEFQPEKEMLGLHSTSVLVQLWIVKQRLLIFFFPNTRARGKNFEFSVARMGDCIFVSHQWTGDCHPDVDFEQLRVLQRAFDRMLGGQAVLKSSQVSYAFLGRGEYILTSEWSEKSLFIWYDYFSCPQLVARSNDQDSLAELQSAVDSISYYIQASKYFVVMAPHVRHVDTGYLLSRETWQSRGWCRFEQVCRELLCNNPNIAVIESAQHWYVMTPFDSWLHPACMGHFSVEEDRDKAPSAVLQLTHRLQCIFSICFISTFSNFIPLVASLSSLRFSGWNMLKLFWHLWFTSITFNSGHLKTTWKNGARCNIRFPAWCERSWCPVWKIPSFTNIEWFWICNTSTPGNMS